MKIRDRRVVLHLAFVSGVTALVVFFIFYPFLPGRHDELATALSSMAQVFGTVGLLLVPIGVLWLVYELRKRTRRKQNLPARARGYYFALASVIASSIIAAAASLGAFTSIGLAFGLGMLALLAYIASRLIPKLKFLKNAETENFNPVPIYLIFIPSVVLETMQSQRAWN